MGYLTKFSNVDFILGLTVKSILQKGGNQLLFSSLKYQVESLLLLAAEERNTTSAQLKVRFMKEEDSPVHLVM